MENSNPPKVTVLMPVYNGVRYLKLAIDSILKQTFTDFEFLIINDGSSDSSEEIIVSYNDVRIVYLKNEENLGLIKTLNKGLALAKGKYIARMDCDDICHIERFSLQTAYLDEHLDHVVVASSYRLINELGETLKIKVKPMEDPQVKWVSMFRTAIEHPVTMFRADIAKIEQYNENSKYAEDHDFWMRLMRHGKIKVLKPLLLSYRAHGTNITSNNNQNLKQKTKEISLDYIHKTFTSNDDDFAPELLLDVFLLNKSVSPQIIKSFCYSLNYLVENFIVKEDCADYEWWIKKQAAGLAAEALLIRGNGKSRLNSILSYLWQARRYHIPLFFRLCDELFSFVKIKLRQCDLN